MHVSSHSSSNRQSYNIAVVGSGGIGKSAITIRFIQSRFTDEYDPTIEDSYRKQLTVDNAKYTIDILDTAGQEEYYMMREQYMRNCDGFLLVYSISSMQSYDELLNFYHQILRVKEVEYIPIVVIGNKSDLESERQVSFKEGEQMGCNISGPFFETSAKYGLNIDVAFQSLVRLLRDNGGEYNKTNDIENAASSVSSSCINEEMIDAKINNSHIKEIDVCSSESSSSQKKVIQGGSSQKLENKSAMGIRKRQQQSQNSNDGSSSSSSSDNCCVIC
ncbi:hypothetical protein KAFR_0D02040 [Kazachstania africana CBS 2517]|uniref:Ras-like protein n=1 Tax=Kazachstania africana (strain ATCC 22294 / BCRC 22015 / CBS 2517 / CECT 1963 / NBRC 1671 / NRRL Y-8276) TaxID=1071382 RepID=H2AU01_KAZAF|nr:hypothetical protein KAFR_0D02040 [Kazachstania africana CBS 2517]CCF57851.1 hypothetical protein KAFR_0D02040 [Kazachstania africana CBS 2517]